jgi:hypothetical protein
VPEARLSRPMLACLGLCAAILIVATVDLVHLESRLPAAPSLQCESKDSSCFNQEAKRRIARADAAKPLERQYRSRAWLYSFAILAAIGVGVAYSLRSRPRKEWLRVFTNLGVAGVWLAIAVTALLLLTAGAGVEVPAAPAYAIPVLMLAAAAVGTLIGRSEDWASEGEAEGVRAAAMGLGKLAIHIGTAGEAKRSRMNELARWFTYTALGLTALTGLLAIVFVLAQPGCEVSGGPPNWTTPIDSIAGGTAILAVAAGIGALVLRRWVPAVICLVLNPISLFFILASTCAFD